jgi:hypothetical protein
MPLFEHGEISTSSIEHPLRIAVLFPQFLHEKFKIELAWAAFR